VDLAGTFVHTFGFTARAPSEKRRVECGAGQENSAKHRANSIAKRIKFWFNDKLCDADHVKSWISKEVKREMTSVLEVCMRLLS
jgi:hypothetical protein